MHPGNHVTGSPREGDPAIAEEVAVTSRAVRGADGSHTFEARLQDGLEGTVAAALTGGNFGRSEARAVPGERTVTEDSRCQGGHDSPNDPIDDTRRNTVWGLCFLQNHPKTAHKNLCLMRQGVMDLFLGEPFTVLVSNFGNRAVHVPKHTGVGLAFPSLTHILTLGASAPGEAEAKEGGGSKNNSSAATEEHVRCEQLATDEDRINSLRTKEYAQIQGPVTNDGKIKSSTAAEGCA